MNSEGSRLSTFAALRRRPTEAAVPLAAGARHYPENGGWGATPDDSQAIFESMTDQEIKPFLGKAVRVTLADRRVFAGVLHTSDESGHGHRHYAIVSDPIREGDRAVRQLIHGGDQIAMIEDASGDPAATP